MCNHKILLHFKDETANICWNTYQVPSTNYQETTWGGDTDTYTGHLGQWEHWEQGRIRVNVVGLLLNKKYLESCKVSKL